MSAAAPASSAADSEAVQGRGGRDARWRRKGRMGAAVRPAALSGSALSEREVVALKRAFVGAWGGLGGRGAGSPQYS